MLASMAAKVRPERRRVVARRSGLRSPLRGTPALARPGEAARLRGGHNWGEVRAVSLQLGALARRVLGGPDGLFAATAVLAVAAMLQTALFAAADAQTAAMIYGLLATVPLLLARRWPLAAAVPITFSTFAVLVSNPKWITLAGLVAQLAIAYVVASRSRRFVSVL